ncbi:MAG: helix-turn-helix transcriptional regulator [Candidatus Margulisbacteria bacterium]|jgi:transcriptional regulator with XRE-family HTH domain|nr:helix-turn-helix transcriptional regulator [Candidatus Margulisiibacteriota bacterium]
MDRAIIEQELKAVISGKLKQIRADNDHSIEKMAEETDLEYTAFYNIYSGRNLPRLPTLIQISQTYAIPMEFWFRNITELKPPEKKENIHRSGLELDILRVFARLDAVTRDVILKILKGYIRKPKYDIK